MENANRRETGKSAAFLAGICDRHLAFRNLGLLREEAEGEWLIRHYHVSKIEA